MFGKLKKIFDKDQDDQPQSQAVSNLTPLQKVSENQSVVNQVPGQIPDNPTQPAGSQVGQTPSAQPQNLQQGLNVNKPQPVSPITPVASQKEPSFQVPKSVGQPVPQASQNQSVNTLNQAPLQNKPSQNINSGASSLSQAGKEDLINQLKPQEPSIKKGVNQASQPGTLVSPVGSAPTPKKVPAPLPGQDQPQENMHKTSTISSSTSMPSVPPKVAPQAQPQPKTPAANVYKNLLDKKQSTVPVSQEPKSVATPAQQAAKPPVSAMKEPAQPPVDSKKLPKEVAAMPPLKQLGKQPGPSQKSQPPQNIPQVPKQTIVKDVKNVQATGTPPSGKSFLGAQTKSQFSKPKLQDKGTKIQPPVSKPQMPGQTFGQRPGVTGQRQKSNFKPQKNQKQYKFSKKQKWHGSKKKKPLSRLLPPKQSLSRQPNTMSQEGDNGFSHLLQIQEKKELIELLAIKHLSPEAQDRILNGLRQFAKKRVAVTFGDLEKATGDKLDIDAILEKTPSSDRLFKHELMKVASDYNNMKTLVEKEQLKEFAK